MPSLHRTSVTLVGRERRVQLQKILLRPRVARAAQESAVRGGRGSSVDSWGLWISTASLFVSSAGVLISLVILSYSRAHLRLSERESLRNPQLRVEEVSWSGAENYERVQELARVRARISEWESMSFEEREFYFDSDEEADESTFSVPKMFKAMHRYVDASNMFMATYEGPVPDHVLSFRLVNQGQRTARDVEGRVYFKQSGLEPINCPGFDARVHGDSHETWPRLHKGSHYREGALLKPVDIPPVSAEKEVAFNIALVRRGTGRCEAKIVFSNPEGDYTEEDVSVDV